MQSATARCCTTVLFVFWISACSEDEQSQRRAILKSANRALAERRGALASGPVTVHAAEHGPHVVQYEQEIDGIEVLGARVNVLVDRELTTLEITGGFTPHAATQTLRAFAIDRAAAVRAAVSAVDRQAAAPAPAEISSDGRYTRFELTPSASFHPSRPARIKAVWYPAGERLVPAYSAEIIGTRPGLERPIALAVIVSGEDGRVLHTRSLIHEYEPFGYRVLADADGTPYYDPYGYTNPHPTGLPDGYVPSAPAPMHLVSVRNAGISTDDPWLPDEATETIGNNVDAFFNADIPDGEGYCWDDGWGPGFNATEGDFRARLTSDRAFDYPYDVTSAPLDYDQCLDVTAPIPVDSTQLNAKIVQSFYTANWLHDLFYDLGYDEVAGNSQADNYGRGGIEGDPLLVHAGYRGTFAFSPADGESPALSLGFNGTSRSHRDVSGFDFGVFAHEWAHTMYGRLTRATYGSAQDGALNEGTADFIGFFLMVREQDRHARVGRPPFHGAYAVGAYMNLDYDDEGDPLPQAGSPGFPDNSYYHGIRRFPTSADPAVNPLTFQHISVANRLPAELGAFDWKGRSLLNAEVHTAGEIWTAALWQCARNILATTPPRLFDEAHRRILGYLVTGLKLFPTDATYTEARNAVLFAMRARSERDYRGCRAGFAARGMGAGAVSPPRFSFSLREVVESHLDSDSALSIIGATLHEVSGGDADGVLDSGELGRLTVTVKNTGFVTTSRVMVYVPSRPGSYEFPSGNRATGIALAPEQEHTVTFAVRILGAQVAQPLTFRLQTWEFLHPEIRAQKDVNFVVNYDLRRDGNVDALAATQTFEADWTRSYDIGLHGCAQFHCVSFDGMDRGDVLDWQWVQHLGEQAYRVADDILSMGTSLETIAFTVSGSEPLQLVLRHDHDFDRETAVGEPFAWPGLGAVEIRIDGGEWESVDPYLISGSGSFVGASGGWRMDTLDFGTALAGREVQFRLHATTGTSFYEDSAYWAISRVEIHGAAQPVFSSVHPD